MRGSPYGTRRWQQLRSAILQRDGYDCKIRGPRCTGAAATVHHILPSSTHPHLFYDPSNLQAACKACNYGDGAVVRAGNRNNRQLVAHLEAVIAEQDATIDELRQQLAHRDDTEAPVHATPRIY